ncbi:hypothetical protein [Chamaesiphon polymorphus]|uniref:hypothetical protein n=1 Tax=Chamaesiphon polymorphus TaxID=2107691 RepID=UPI001C63540C|nr:hypothetical protein [Chamaesiphon polymorphus]
MKSIQPPKTPLKDLELITVRGISLRCFSFARSTVDLDKEIINLFKSGYTILTVWGEYDPNVPCVVFTWHPKLLDPVENDLSTTQD